MASPKHTQYQRVGHVGSFLRPQHLLDARKQTESGELPLADLRRVEDEIISQLVEDQIKAGLKTVTDGEQRREYFHLDFLKHLDGVAIVQNTLTQDSGFVPPSVHVVGKIRHSKPIQLDDFLFLKSQAKAAVPKVTIPSPTMAHFRAGRAGISQDAYPDLAEFFDDLASAYRDEIKSLYDAGCRYIQLDDTNLAYLCDPDMRAAAQQRGEDLETLPTRYASLINACVRDRPEDLVIGLHLCKGNFRSQFFAQGGYEPIAKTLFSDIDVNVLYLEWEDARSGDFSPLRFLSDDRVVVLGLLSSKFSQLEDKQEIVAKIREAASFAPRGLEQLALSTQCGFSSTVHGNNISHEDQWAKLRLANEIAQEVWGTA